MGSTVAALGSRVESRLDVASRASEKGTVPHRERYLFICTNRREDTNPKGSCAQKGSEELVKRFKEAFIKRGAVKRVRACSSSCLDLCEVGASIVQEPEHVAYGHVTEADVDEIADCVVAGKVCERLVVFPKPEPEAKG
jgi:(2Fe-2S) ferredoxin